MRAAAGRAYAEMAAAGYGAVGEFHYVHHQPDGTPYADPNAMAVAVAEAARAAGLVVVLLPTAYHRAGWQRPPSEGQRRFCDPDVETFLARVDALRAWAAGRDGVHVGVAAHSVRAVPADWLEAIAAYADGHGLVRHVHAHEQPRELEECRAEHGVSPIELLHRTGFLGPRTSVIHGIHVGTADVARLAASDTIVVSCPTTEGSLGRRPLPGARLPRRGRADGDRQRLERPHRPVRGGARARDARPPRAPHAPRAAGRRRRPVGASWRAPGRPSLGLEDAGTIAVDRDHPELAGVAAADLPLAVATCASAAAVCRTVGDRAREPPPGVLAWTRGHRDRRTRDPPPAPRRRTARALAAGRRRL